MLFSIRSNFAQTLISYRISCVPKNLIFSLIFFVTSTIMGCGGEEDTTAFGAPNATSNATLTWNAPLTRTDGTPLPVSEIGGYRVYMGADANNLSLIADISTPYVMKYEVKNLKAGRYYFSITTYDKRHIESDLSNIVDKKI